MPPVDIEQLPASLVERFNGAVAELQMRPLAFFIPFSHKRDRWARLRFWIICSLLAAPPALGAFPSTLPLLACKTWRDPPSGFDLVFAISTLERWSYAARRANDPVSAFKDRLRGDVGRLPSMTPKVIDCSTIQYRAPPGPGRPPLFR
jgi:hypothetical protein